MIIKQDSKFEKRYKELSDLRDGYANLVVSAVSFPNLPLSEEDFWIAEMRAEELDSAISLADDVANYQKSIQIKPIKLRK